MKRFNNTPYRRNIGVPQVNTVTLKQGMDKLIADILKLKRPGVPLLIVMRKPKNNLN